MCSPCGPPGAALTPRAAPTVVSWNGKKLGKKPADDEKKLEDFGVKDGAKPFQVRAAPRAPSGQPGPIAIYPIGIRNLGMTHAPGQAMAGCDPLDAGMARRMVAERDPRSDVARESLGQQDMGS